MKLATKKLIEEENLTEWSLKLQKSGRKERLALLKKKGLLSSIKEEKE